MTLPEHCRSIITGGGSGLGRALAMELGGRGARILIADVNEAGGTETVRMLTDAGVQAHFQACDVRDAAQVEALAEAADSTIGGVDLMVNNAGVAVTGKIGEVSLEDWRFIVDVNLLGVVHGCHTFAPRFVQQGRGAFLNVASAAGLLCPPDMGPYNVTKAAVVALSETLHAELGPKNVGVSVLCPTFFETNLMQTSRGPERHRSMATKMMKRSNVQASDVSRAALDALDDNRLYVVPMFDGRAMWGLKRLMPQTYAGLVAWFSKRNLLPS
jgi:NAD(P)-dependent dehydrogenase (short-subunit alcohol dehydrogenase family)